MCDVDVMTPLLSFGRAEVDSGGAPRASTAGTERGAGRLIAIVRAGDDVVLADDAPAVLPDYAPAMSAAAVAVRRRWDLIPRQWILLDAFAGTALTAAALAAVTTLRHDLTVPVTVAAAAMCTSAVVWRRTHPTAAFVVALTAVVGYQISGQDPQGDFVTAAIGLVAYMAGRAETRRRHTVALAGYGAVACALIEMDSGFSFGNLMLTWVPLVVAPMTAGVLVTRRGLLVERLRANEARLLDEQQLAQARSVAAERCRVARDLHDVLAHCVSAMVIQTGAARLLAPTDGPASLAALDTVVECGRTALTDLRRVVGPLRRDAVRDPADAAGLAGLESLVARSRAAGVEVRLQVDDSAPAPAEVDMTVFRIVQEALTNVRKHAPDAAATVTVTRTPAAVDIVVTDTGPARELPGVIGSGQGLAGIRERAALSGGSLRAGPTAAGGFAVRVHLPVPAGDDTAAEPTRPRIARRLSRVQVDLLFALAWSVPLEIEAFLSPHRNGPVALTAAAVFGMAAAGVIRRVAPLRFAGIVGGLAIALSTGVAAPQRPSVVGAYTVFVVSYTVATCCPRVRAWLGLALMLTGTAIVSGINGSAGVAVGGALIVTLVWIVGRLVRSQRELAHRLRGTATRLAAEAATRAEIARDEERARIARELHALVAGLVTAMVVQAEAAGDQLAADHPDAATHAMSEVEHTGRVALGHMRRLLGVLRAVPDAIPRPIAPMAAP
jgi:signal transduction histidine kinase